MNILSTVTEIAVLEILKGCGIISLQWIKAVLRIC